MILAKTFLAAFHFGIILCEKAAYVASPAIFSINKKCEKRSLVKTFKKI